MAVDLSEIEAHFVHRGGVCSVKAVYEQLKPKDRAMLREALAKDKSDFPASALARWLKKDKGITIAEKNLARHRNGDCACGQI